MDSHKVVKEGVQFVDNLKPQCQLAYSKASIDRVVSSE